MADKRKRRDKNKETYSELVAHLKKREKNLKAKLKETETLLKETHHRIKNDIQIIASLLRLQAGAVKDDKLREILLTSQSRIRTISLIHEKLYQSRDLATVDCGDYLRLLSGQIFRLAGVDPTVIRLEVEAEPVKMEAKRAVPCGLIVNELVLNALKYAFPQGKAGTIRVEMKSQAGGRYSLTVSDDGVGLPENIDPLKPERLGLQIFNDLVKQLGGNWEIDRAAGTKFKITF